MILYFSATGNTKLIAQTLAKRLDDEAVDLLSRIKKNDYSEIKSDLPFVITLPFSQHTYCSPLMTVPEMLWSLGCAGDHLG